MNRRILVTSAALALLAIAAGCGKGSKVAGPAAPVGTIADLQRAIASAYVAGSVLPTNVDTTASLLATVDVDGLRAAAALFLYLGNLADAGAVSARVNAPVGPGVAESALDELSVNVSGLYQYVYTSLTAHPLGINLPFDGASYHRFTVAGSGSFPAFVDSVQSVAMITVSAPAASETVSRAADLAVIWSNAGADTTVYVICAVSSQVDTAKVAFGTLVRDVAGAAVVPTARLAALPAGAARLSVARYRLVYHAEGGRAVGLACEAAQTRNLTLN